MNIGDKVKIKKSPSKWFSDGEEVIVEYFWDSKTVTVRKKDDSWRLKIKIADLIVGGTQHETDT